MSRWFRMYNEVLDDPKVQRLGGDDFKVWVNLLCLTSRLDGSLPPIEDIGFSLRLDAKKAKAVVSRLVEAGLLEEVEGRFVPHAWNDRQYQSDVSTSRVKQFRERKKSASRNSDETFHATAPDTDTDTDKNSVTNVTAKSSSTDPEKVMFDSGIRSLGDAGVPAAKARPLLGKWKRDHGAAAVIAALGAAQREGAIDPVGFIEGRFRHERKQVDDGFSIGGVRMSSPC